MVKIYKQPFAHDGDTIAIPDASQPDGKMSSADGWTPDYQLPKTDPNYKPVGRQEINGVFKDVTEALGQVQVQGAASWSEDGAPYPINAQVYHNGKQWIALRANSVEPVEGDDWKAILFENIGQANETDLGLVQLATTAEAQALVNDASAMTPKKLADAFGGSNQGLTSNGYQKLPGGLIVQWGTTAALAQNESIVVTLPVAFPTAILNAQASYGSDPANNNGTGALAAIRTSTSQITITKGVNGTSAEDLLTTQWLAIGY